MKQSYPVPVPISVRIFPPYEGTSFNSKEKWNLEHFKLHNCVRRKDEKEVGMPN